MNDHVHAPYILDHVSAIAHCRCGRSSPDLYDGWMSGRQPLRFVEDVLPVVVMRDPYFEVEEWP